MKTVSVYLLWHPIELDGRRRGIGAPLNRYAPLIRFEDDWKTPPLNAWSVVINCDDEADSRNLQKGTIQFLVEEAPQHLLYEGSKFDLFEGPRRVASGIVRVAESVPTP